MLEMLKPCGEEDTKEPSETYTIIQANNPIIQSYIPFPSHPIVYPNYRIPYRLNVNARSFSGAYCDRTSIRHVSAAYIRCMHIFAYITI